MNYNDLTGLFHSSDAEDWAAMTTHQGEQSAYLRNDVNLRIVSSEDEEHIQNSNYQAGWAQRWPNKNAVGYYYYLYYNSTLITKFVLVAVDGGRVLLPAPETDESTVVTQSAYKVAQIFNGGHLGEYMERAGLEVSPVRDML